MLGRIYANMAGRAGFSNAPTTASAILEKAIDYY